jgi:hypothetical protein
MPFLLKKLTFDGAKVGTQLKSTKRNNIYIFTNKNKKQKIIEEIYKFKNLLD